MTPADWVAIRLTAALAATAISFFTGLEGWAPLLIQALAFSRSIFTVGARVTGL